MKSKCILWVLPMLWSDEMNVDSKRGRMTFKQCQWGDATVCTSVHQRPFGVWPDADVDAWC